VTTTPLQSSKCNDDDDDDDGGGGGGRRGGLFSVAPDDSRLNLPILDVQASRQVIIIAASETLQTAFSLTALLDNKAILLCDVQLCNA
jgi:hypothetical protein